MEWATALYRSNVVIGDGHRVTSDVQFSDMPYYTPLRYPGGKRRLAKCIRDLIEHNGLSDIEYYEPFAGGAAIGLDLLINEYANTIHLNDLARPVFAFWHTVINETEWLCKKIETMSVSMNQWHRQKKVYASQESADLAELGLATLFLNRTNRSGILSAGVIGGKKQAGKWKLGVRFNPAWIVEKIRQISRFQDRIRLSSVDACQFVSELNLTGGSKSFLFIDPPYIERSRLLYLNSYSIDDHKKLESVVSDSHLSYVVTYDEAAIRHKVFARNRRLVYGIAYTAQRKYEGIEVMYLSNDLEIPTPKDLLGPPMSYIPQRSILQRSS